MVRSRARKSGGALIMIALWLASPLARTAECVVENDEVSVVGSLSRETFAGPPNYESVDRGDKAETVWILTLREPLTLCPVAARNGEAHTLGSINRFQLVIYGEQRGLKQALIARYASIRGRIFLRHTGHHHTAALIEVAELQPATQSSLRVR
jgi:hypothetical protein